MITQILIITVLIYLCHSLRIDKRNEIQGKIYIENLNIKTAEMVRKDSVLSWAYQSNITKENMEAHMKFMAGMAKFQRKTWENTITYPWKLYESPDLRRQFEMFSILGTAALSPEKLTRLSIISTQMGSTYATAKICSFSDKTKCDLALEPELENIFIQSENCEELKHVWVEWRNATGKKVRNVFAEYVALQNEAAVLNNLTDNTSAWLKAYEDDNFQNSMKDLWEQIEPFYRSIHAYVRRKLKQKYGKCATSNNGHIRAHLLGNMWAQSWSNIYKHVTPYPNSPISNVTNEMIAQNYTPLKIFKTAEEFFISINLTAMPELFWKNSIIEKPEGRELVCHASAWDFTDGKDFRIKQCTRVNADDLQTVHHEMGHIEYYLQYKDLPYVFRSGANPGFHEAIGDVISLSASSEKHLHKIGLLKEHKESYESNINKLMQIALSIVVFLPYGYILDQWRWKVFSGEIKPENYNAEWWSLRKNIQGIAAPVERSEDDFDPGAKYHVIAGVPYIRYFVSHVIQFQFHKALCEKAGEYEANNPEKALHQCDIYQSTAAGNALAEVLRMGASKPWQDAMEILTGQRKIDASALMEFFAPLREWLDKENQKNGEKLGWNNNKS